MMKRLLFWMAALLVAIGGVQQAKAYGTNDLESAGWTKVTDMTSMTLSDYYFMLIDAGSSLYSVSNARPGTDSKPTYQTLQDPISDAGQVWKISNDGSAYYLQSLVDGWYFIGARDANAGWTDYMAAESTNGNFAFAVTDGKFSITSVFANGLVGPWEDADHVDLNYKLHWNALEDNFYEELACNKGAQHAPGFYIYAISRATYDNIRRSSSKLAANGWTQVTGTDQLGKSGYYYTLLDVSEAGYESGLVMAGGTGRPNYQAMNISSDNKIQIWTMASKGDGYQMKNCETDTYVFCNGGTDWNTGFTNDANNQYTEFRFTLNNGFWVISNVNSLQRSLGRWSNSPYRPGTGENIAANKADNEGKRQFLIYSIPSIAGVAIALPEGGAMEANQWYYFDVNSEEEYSFNTTTANAIVWTADGTLLESEANSQLPSGNTNLTTGRYYIKSSSDNNFVLEAPRPTTEQIAELQSLITSGDAKILGFDNGEYAPYNNVAAILALADAQTLDLNNPNQYTQSFIEGKIAAMQNATWTANTSEVNAIFDGTFEAASSVTTNTCPTGWHGSDTHYTEGYWVRLMHGTADSNAGLLHFANGNAMMAKSTPRYGLEPGYTLPLKANTYYKISFDFAGWGGGNADKNTTIVITDANGNAVSVVPAATANVKENGNSNQDAWQTYTGVFQTGDAGDYRLTFNKAEGDGSTWQITYGNIELVRYNNEALPYTLETGAMNADVRTAQQNSAATYDGDPTVENYEALLAAIEAAKASEAIYKTINQRISALDAQKGSVDISELTTKYNDGVYVNADDVIFAYHDIVKVALANPTEGTDMTPFIINPSGNFDGNFWWNINSSGGNSGPVMLGDNRAFECWNAGGTFDYNQRIADLPNGTYTISADLYNSLNNQEGATFKPAAGVYGTSSNEAYKLVDVDGTELITYTTGNIVVTNGQITLGIKTLEPLAARWFVADNFRLTYVSSEALVAPEMPTEQMYAGAKAEMQAALATWTYDKSTDNYNALVEKINAANQSVELYKQIKARLDILTSAGQRGSISEEDEMAMSFYTKYSNGTVNETADATTGTYTSLDEVVPEYQANIAAYWTANAPAVDADLTSLIVNNSFEFGNLDTWAYYNGADCGARENANGTYTIDIADGNYVANFWNNNADVKYIVKDIALPNGTYELKAIFASDEGVTINFTAESGIGAENRIGEVRNTFTTEAAKGVGAEKTLEVVVHNGTLRLGANTTSWFKVDNFRLIYKSANATVAPALAEGQMSQTAKQAMLDAQAAHTGTPSVENYNALLAKIAEAQQSIAVYEQIASTLAKLTENASQRGDIDEATEKAMTFYTNYSAGQVNGAADATTGTYETLDDMIAQYRTDIAAYWTANAPAAGADLTAYIVNQGFEFGNVVGWEEENKGGGVDAGARDAHNETYIFSDSEGDFIFNSWNNNWAEITLTQTLNGVPQGTYEMTAVFAAEGFNDIEFIGTNIREDGTPDETADKFRPVDINQRADKKTGLTRTIEVFVTDGKLKINGNTWGFFKADNFRLVYKSATLSDLADEPMNRYEKNDYDAAKAAYEANPTKENLRELAAYKIICENSIKAYKAAKKTLDHVKDMMDHTNVYTYDAFFTIDDMYRKYGPEEGFYGFRTLEDDVAYDLERMFFGNGNYRDSNNENIPAVPFIASAWDCGHNGYAYVETGPGKEGTEPGSDYYGNTWSREGLDDGTNMLTPYLEYWRYGDQLLNPRVLTATVEGTPNAEYTVKMFVRVRTNVQYEEGNDSTKPHGMTIQIGDGAKFTPNWQYIDNEGTQYVLNNARQLWVCNLWLPAHQGDANNASYLLPKGNADAEGNFKIKFEIEEGSNVTWLSMKDVYVNYETEIPDTAMAALKAQIDYADAHKLGFDFKGDEHGTAVDEYAPYNNVPQLMALKRAKQVYDSPQNVFLVRNVTKALKAVNYNDPNMDDLHPVYNEATDLWTKNTEEMNGFYWKNDYTNSDVEHIEWYEYEDDCIMPSGWDLIGRNDGFNTGIKKLGVNTEDTGMKALEDQTGLLAKYETDYGNQIGYTLPLKKGVKYIMTFKYAYMGEGTCTEPTDITLTVPAAGASGDDTTTSGLEVTTFTPEGQGTEDLGKWKMYRATFTPTIENEEHPGEPVNYLITFDKDNAHDPVPIMMGELTLVRYKEAAALGDSILLIDGTNQAGYRYTPDFVGSDFKVTRSWNNGGETADGAYNTLVLPFSLDGSELKTALGDNFNGKVYFYTGATYTGGDEYYTLNFDERENSGIFANVPVLIWNEKANSINNLTNYEFKNTVTKYVKNDLTVDPGYNDDTKYKYNLVGTYETIKIPAGASYITADNNFKKSTGKANLAATRAYFIPLDKDGNVSTMAKLMGFSINDIPTGIMAIEEDGEMHVTSGNIYTVDGRLVRQNATSLEDLPKGIYIVDGKKYFVK